MEVARRDEKITMALPNMLLSSTYAINRSNSKRVSVGLEFNGECFVPVIKLCSSGSPQNYISLNEISWELFYAASGEIESYLQNGYAAYSEFSQPKNIELPYHTITFGQSYGNNAIIVSKRSNNPVKKSVGPQEDLEEKETSSISALDSIFEPQTEVKRKSNTNSNAGIVMQMTSYSGLKEMVPVIMIKFNEMRQKSEVVNRAYASIIECLTEKFLYEATDKVKNCLKISHFFRQYYVIIKNDIENYVKEKFVHDLSNVSLDENSLELILAELFACYLQYIALDVKNKLFPSTN